MTPRATAVRDAALALFAERGYRGTTMRAIAEAVGLQAPALYNHVSSKQRLLEEIMVATIVQLLEDFDEAVSTTDDPAEQLRRAVEAHVRYHARHRFEAFVGNRELFNLAEPARSQQVEYRTRYASGFREIIERGCATGRFEVSSSRLAAYAILEMGIGVAVWFRPDGEFSEAAVANRYGQFALRIVNGD
jgi:AcrR family transcriptional regulator